MQRCDLAVVHPVLEQEKCTVSFVRGRLPDVEAATEEPAPLAVLL
jgi:hypothetical protein